MNMWFTKLIKQFFFWIDKIVFNLIPAIYDLLITIARTSVLTQSDIIDMAYRIYKLLAIFMIFKVTLSLITYIVNPDDFTDKSKGVAKLGSNIVISLALLILTPYLFNYAYQIQTIILEDNSLAVLVFGEDAKSGESFFNTAGDDMAFTTMSAFFSPNLSVGNLHQCTTLYTGEGSNAKFNASCKVALEELSDDGANEKFTMTTLNNYVAGVENRNLSLMFRQDIVLATATMDDEEEFVMDYKFIFSTATGVIVILLLLNFCMDVAVRSLKLAFLQLVAPIPILSYVDPKGGKDGMFKKWYEMCFQTYLSLFVRLLALYFSVFVISKVASVRLVDIIDGSYQTNAFVAVFIIIGALMFAKQFPKILEGLGVKIDGGSGKFTINPIKKLEEGAMFGKKLAGAARVPVKAAKGIGTAALVGGASAIMGHGVRGMGSAFKGAMKGEKFGKNFSSSYAAARARHKEVEEMRADGVNPWEVYGQNIANNFRGVTPVERVKKNIEKMDNVSKGYDTIRSTVLAVDKDAKAQNNLIKGIESAGVSSFKDGVSVKLSNGGTVEGVENGVVKSAAQIYEELLRKENEILDNRVISLANGSATWSGDASAIANAQTTVSNTIDAMQAEIDYIRKEVPGVNIQDVKVGNTVQDVKVTGKGAQGSKNAYQTTVTHEMAVDKYTKKPKK